MGLFGYDVVPAVGAVSSTESVNLGVRFSPDQDGTISSVKFYRGPEQQGSYTASLWNTPDGALLARTTFPASTTSGWQTTSLGKTVRIQKDLTYVVSYLASDGRYPVTPDDFAQPHTNNGLTVPTAGGLSNVARDNNLPEVSETSNYLIDVLFIPANTSTPTTPPTTPPSTTPTATPSPASPTPTPTPSPTPTPTPSPVSPTPTPTPSPVATAPTPGPVGSGDALWVHRPVDSSTVRAALAKRVFFGHQSIGGQVMKGITTYSKEAGLGTPGYPDPETGDLPRDGGFFAQSYVGENGDPASKLAEFDLILRSGVANQIDVAVLKFCYADIRTGESDPRTVFEDYRSTIAALERDFPQVTFIYATEPIVMAVNSDGPNNIPRGVFNELVRAEYGHTGRLWDVAAIESTTLAGARVQGSYQGVVYDALNPEFASPDQRHIYGAGETAVAGPLLELVAKS